jgi:hypothetical protein
VKFAFIAVETARYPARVLCRTVEVSRAGFYAWHTRPPAPRTQQDQRLGVEIQAIHAETRQRYGRPRVHAELRDRGQRAKPGEDHYAAPCRACVPKYISSGVR